IEQKPRADFVGAKGARLKAAATKPKPAAKRCVKGKASGLPPGKAWAVRPELQSFRGGERFAVLADLIDKVIGVARGARNSESTLHRQGKFAGTAARDAMSLGHASGF